MSTSRSIRTIMSICGDPSLSISAIRRSRRSSAIAVRPRRAPATFRSTFPPRFRRARRRQRREEETSQNSRGPMGRPPKSMPQSARAPTKGDEEEDEEDEEEAESESASESALDASPSRVEWPLASRGHSSRARASSIACSRRMRSMISATSFEAAPLPCTMGTSPTRLCNSCSARATSYSDETSLSTAKSRQACLRSTRAASFSNGTRSIGRALSLRWRNTPRCSRTASHASERRGTKHAVNVTRTSSPSSSPFRRASARFARSASTSSRTEATTSASLCMSSSLGRTTNITSAHVVSSVPPSR